MEDIYLDNGALGNNTKVTVDWDTLENKVTDLKNNINTNLKELSLITNSKIIDGAIKSLKDIINKLNIDFQNLKTNNSYSMYLEKVYFVESQNVSYNTILSSIIVLKETKEV